MQAMGAMIQKLCVCPHGVEFESLVQEIVEHPIAHLLGKSSHQMIAVNFLYMQNPNNPTVQRAEAARAIARHMNLDEDLRYVLLELRKAEYDAGFRPYSLTSG